MRIVCPLQFAVVVAAGFSLLASAPLRAQNLENVAISATVYEQGATHNNGKSTATIAAPSTITTGSLLRQLALDERGLGLWESNTFPGGAKLVYSGATGFEVVDKHNDLLLSVSNVMTLQSAGQVLIDSGKTNDDNGSGTENQLQLATFGYDATAGATNASGGTTNTMRFLVTCLATSSVASTAPGAHGNYTQTDTIFLHSGLGEGTNAAETNILITGFTATIATHTNLQLASVTGDTNIPAPTNTTVTVTNTVTDTNTSTSSGTTPPPPPLP